MLTRVVSSGYSSTKLYWQLVPTRIVCSKESLGTLFEMRVLIIISWSELVPSKSMIVSLFRNVRAKSVLDAAAVRANDGEQKDYSFI